MQSVWVGFSAPSRVMAVLSFYCNTSEDYTHHLLIGSTRTLINRGYETKAGLHRIKLSYASGLTHWYRGRGILIKVVWRSFHHSRSSVWAVHGRAVLDFIAIKVRQS